MFQWVILLGGVTLMVAQSRRFSDAVQEMVRRLPEIGDILRVHIVFFVSFAQPPTDWWRSSAQAGGLYVEGSGATVNVGNSIFARNLIINKSGTSTPHDLSTQKSGKVTSYDYNIVVKPGTTLSP